MESNGGGRMQDSEYFLQWGNRKRNRVPRNTTTTTTITRDDKKKNNSTSTLRSNTYRKASSSSPDNNNDHHYTYTNRRGGGGVGVGSNNSKGKLGHYVWPKLHLGLSDKEKEDDFMAMKGCKPPQRPKKRPKAIQKSLLLVCPGGWLADMYQDRYEIREKKSSKKRARGLKAMGSLESDSE